MQTPLTIISEASPHYEYMRINGIKADAERRFEVLNPYTDEVVATCPRGTVEDVRQAFSVAQNYRPVLTRFERQRILFKTAELLLTRKDEISDLITAEAGLSKKDSLYEVGRACDVFNLAGQLCLHDDGEIFSCDLTPHGQTRKILQ